VNELIGLAMSLPDDLKAKSISAIGRLIMGAADIPASWLEAKAASIKADGKARDLITLRVSEAVAEKLASDPETLERAAARFASKIYTHQKNVEEVAKIAIDELRSNSELPRTGGKISDRWLDHFAAVSELQGDGAMQLYFGKILAGEIAAPGRFDPATLNVLSTLSAATARDFIKLCQMAIEMGEIGYAMISTQTLASPNTTLNSVSEKSRIKGEQLGEFGLGLSALLRLRSAGLLASLPEEEYPALSRVSRWKAAVAWKSDRSHRCEPPRRSAW
jgi:hypothetical protein